MFLRRIGDPDSARVPVFGGPTMPDVRMEASDVPVAFVPSLESLALGLVVHGTQREAIAAARETAMRQGSEMLIHGENGRIRERNTYGRDPYPPKG